MAVRLTNNTVAEERAEGALLRMTAEFEVSTRRYEHAMLTATFGAAGESR
jgi:hypothetical protein